MSRHSRGRRGHHNYVEEEPFLPVNPESVNSQAPRTMPSGMNSVSLAGGQGYGSTPEIVYDCQDPIYEYNGGPSAQAQPPPILYDLVVVFPIGGNDVKPPNSWWGCVDKDASPGNLISHHAAKKLGITSYKQTSKNTASTFGSKSKIYGTFTMTWRGYWGDDHVTRESKFYVCDKQPWKGYDIVAVKGLEPRMPSQFPASGQDDNGYDADDAGQADR